MDVKMMFGTIVRTFKKYSPEICIGAGIVGMFTAGVVACEKTYKHAHKILKCAEEEKNYIQNEPELEEEEKTKAIAITNLKTVGKFVKLYSIPFVIDLASSFCIGAGTGILKRRLTAATMLAATLGESLIAYRVRVADKIGVEEEAKLYLGVQEEIISEKITDENGKTKTVKNTVATDIDPITKYYFILDDNWPLWEPNVDRVEYKITSMLKTINERKFEKMGFYDYNRLAEDFLFGEKFCPEGQLLTWIWKKDLSKEENYIQFIGLHEEFEKYRQGKQKFIILNPNFDGPHIDKIESQKPMFLNELE